MCAVCGLLVTCRLNAVSNAISYAKFFSRSHDAVIRVYDTAGNVNETHDTRATSKSRDRYAPEAKSRHAVEA